MMDTASTVSTWSWRDNFEAAAISRSRHQKIESYHKTRIEFEIQPFAIEQKMFFVPCKPPRFKLNKKTGSMEPETIPIPFLEVSAGPLVFKITRNTDAGTVIRRSHEICRRCGDAAGKRFTDEALAFIKPKESKPERKPLANPFHAAASGICNRFRKGRIQSEIGSPMFEYRDAEQAEKDILKSATLADAFQASAAVRKAITPSRRHKAA